MTDMKNVFPAPGTGKPQAFGLQDIFWNGAFCAFEARVEVKAISVNKTWSFPAYVSSFRDSYTPNFESVNVFGRIDPIYTFTHTTRKIDVGMDIVSHHIGEARKNWVEINEMAQGLYATYRKMGSEDIISSPPIFGLRFHNLIREVNTGGVMQDFVYGVLTGGVAIEPLIEEGYFYSGNLVQENWDLDDPEKAKQYRPFSENYAGLFIYPKSFKITLSMDVLHTQFRGNTGKLLSPGGPSVSLLSESLPDQNISRNAYDVREADSREEVKRVAREKANKKLASGRK